MNESLNPDSQKNADWKAPAAPTPGGEVPDWQLWEHKINRDEQGNEIESVRIPDGQFFALGPDERFAQIKEGNTRNPYIIRGEKTISFEQWQKEKEGLTTESQSYESLRQPKLDLNKNRLNEVIKQCRQPGALFGREVNVTPEDRQQIEMILKEAQQIVDQSIAQNPRYAEFQKLKDDIDRKGAIIDIAGTLSWLIDGGEATSVQEIRKGDRVEIVVPTDVYNTYHWDVIVKRAHASLKSSGMAGGYSASYLGTELYQLAHLLKQNNKI